MQTLPITESAPAAAGFAAVRCRLAHRLVARTCRMLWLLPVLAIGACAASTGAPASAPGSTALAPGSPSAPSAPTVSAPGATALLQAPDQALRDLQTAIGSAACTRDAQCHTVGVGAKPCGGPEGYLSWSDQNADAATIAALAERYRNVRKAENERSGLMSNCRFAPDPGAVCRLPPAGGTQRCMLRTTARDGAV